VDKRYKVAAVIGEIQQYQRIGYKSLEPNPTMQYYLRHLETVDEEEAYRISLKVEPRKPDEAIESLLMEEEKLRAQVKSLQLRNADLERHNRHLQQMLSKANTEVQRLRGSWAGGPPPRGGGAAGAPGAPGGGNSSPGGGSHQPVRTPMKKQAQRGNHSPRGAHGGRGGSNNKVRTSSPDARRVFNRQASAQDGRMDRPRASLTQSASSSQLPSPTAERRAADRTASDESRRMWLSASRTNVG